MRSWENRKSLLQISHRVWTTYRMCKGTLLAILTRRHMIPLFINKYPHQHAGLTIRFDPCNPTVRGFYKKKKKNWCVIYRGFIDLQDADWTILQRSTTHLCILIEAHGGFQFTYSFLELRYLHSRNNITGSLVMSNIKLIDPHGHQEIFQLYRHHYLPLQPGKTCLAQGDSVIHRLLSLQHLGLTPSLGFFLLEPFWF